MIIQANALTIPLQDQSVQCCVCSPPYWGLRDYGVAGQLGLEPTPEAYVADMVAVFREVWRVLRDDGVLWLNLGDSYAATSKGENRTPEELAANSGLRRDGRPEDARLRQIANSKTSKAEQRAKIDLSQSNLKPKDLVGIPWRVAFALQADGWYLRSDCIWSKPNPMPESVTDRPTKAHEYLFMLSKQERYYYDAEAVKEDSVGETSGAAASFKRTGSKRGESICPNSPMPTHREDREMIPYDGPTRNRRTVWTIATTPYSGAHFATYPPALVEPCIKAGSRPGDVVLDPFNGSGTTGLVAQQLGRRYVGLDLSWEYLQLAKERLGMKAWEEWEHGIQAGNDGYHDLPLFQAVQP